MSHAGHDDRTRSERVRVADLEDASRDGGSSRTCGIIRGNDQLAEVVLLQGVGRRGERERRAKRQRGARGDVNADGVLKLAAGKKKIVLVRPV